MTCIIKELMLRGMQMDSLKMSKCLIEMQTI
jgi:hypothetical protein